MAVTDFGTRLRDWRRRRGVSQLQLGARAEVSQRHISFLETGRSRPSREMVLHLGRTLDLPLREQNLLLASAGFPAAHTETPVDAMAGVAEIIGFLLEAHEPNMAIVMDRRWNLVGANTAAGRFTAAVLGGPDMRVFLLSDLVEGTAKEIVELRVQGTPTEPQVSATRSGRWSTPPATRATTSCITWATSPTSVECWATSSRPSKRAT